MVTLLVDLISFGMSVVGYVFTALALYTISKRRGIKHPWLAWIPVANLWLLGCISDQYRYVTRGQVLTRRKSLLTLNIVSNVLLIWSLVMIVVMTFQFLPYLPAELRSPEKFSELMMMSESEQTEFIENLSLQIGNPSPDVLRMLAIEALIMAVPALVALVLTVIQVVLMYKCYYDIYLAAEPASAGMYLGLSIAGNFLGLSILLPILLFTVREKDLGMPPRGGFPTPNAQPVYTQIIDDNGTTNQ